MKRTKQTMLTAAVFAAALGLSSSGTAVSAALTFSPDSQRTAAVLYGPPPLRGDIDENRYLDARDLTLMKRYHLMRRQDSSYQPDYLYPYRMDGNMEIAGTSDVRMLRNRLTGSSDPVKFEIRVKWVPYLSTEVPDSEEERLALEKRAKEIADLDDHYYAYAWNEKGEDVYLKIPAYFTYLQENDFYFPVSFTSVPDADHPERTTLHVQMYFRKLTEEEATLVSDSYSRSDLELPDREPSAEDITIDLELCSRLEKEDGSVQLYDKCEVEYDVLTGKYLVHDCLPPEEWFPE